MWESNEPGFKPPALCLGYKVLPFLGSISKLQNGDDEHVTVLAETDDTVPISQTGK